MFSVPLNPKLNPNQFNGFLNFLQDHKHLIFDVYFTCRIAPFEQDAMGDVFYNSNDDLVENALIIQNILNIPISATFNNISVRCTQNNLNTWIKNFKPLYEKGIRSVTLPCTHWVATGQIQKEFPDLYIKNTILKKLNNSSSVFQEYKQGFNYINLDRNLMRNKDELIKIKELKEKFNFKVSLLANEGCLGECPMMDEHYYFNCTRTNGPQYFNDVISRVSCPKWDILDKSTKFKTANIPPFKEDWDELLSYVDVLKMHGRESIEQLNNTIEIIYNYNINNKILFSDFNEYLKDNEQMFSVWKEYIKNCKFECWNCEKCDNLAKSKDIFNFSDKIKLITESLCQTYLL